jgi:sterol desaturase/sphingolipid hydroxylase (fatty acid hydroxylase superfamily)
MLHLQIVDEISLCFAMVLFWARLLPARLRWLSGWLITPDLHRLHHSMAYAENNSNFGNLVPWWDRLFATLRLAPEGEFKVGLAEFSGAEFQRLDKLLIQPLLVNGVPPPRAQV